MSDTNFVGRIRSIESGGRRFGADGKILEGPVTRFGTAKGDMQVLDSTFANPGFGVVPARDGSPAERARVGEDYATALLGHFGGNEAVAAAAYNYGPGNVQKLIAKHGNDWTSFLPAETKNYVAKVARVGGRQSSPEGVTPAAASLPVMQPAPQQVVLAQADPSFAVQATPPGRRMAPVDQGPDAWQEFLRTMPQNHQPVNVADIDYSNLQPARQLPRFQYQESENRRPNFEAFSSWKGRAG